MSERPFAGGSRAMSVDIRVQRGDFTLEAAFEVGAGEIVAVIGPNGSGKSTLLHAIAGQIPAAGTVRVGGRILDAPAIASTGRPVHLPPAQRRVALLGQRAALFPHLSVRENVEFGPRAQGVPRGEARRTAARWLEEVGLGGLAARRPAALSGGQQQRVALARALASAPDALLLDEPFAALDAQTAGQARRLIAAQRTARDGQQDPAQDPGRSTAIPILLVTHDPMDALILASRTVVLHDGSVAQEGRTAEVLGHPRSDFVAAVAGVNRLTVVGEGRHLRPTDGRASGLGFHGTAGLGDGERGSVVFAPGSVRVHALPDDPGAVVGRPNHWMGSVAQLEPVPGGIRLFTAEQPGIAVDCPSTVAVAVGLRPGLRLAFSVAAEDVSVRPDDH
ncbi:ABC transporter ATP-binding protein [Microbacterium capsulatum]|uniref:ABC transporter ATP-binding protein n=1 Tax=Microbacterium capsulatum TaxID=3041921 RepID=A0ABU0XJI5_9MICO|nr:ABC transporter ATP-binding protein [Microbacterium sp. ASV81]MDQ4215306.1 ABC transporter ATP-binding protein [Microbacterium sp. ASV81]